MDPDRQFPIVKDMKPQLMLTLPVVNLFASTSEERVSVVSASMAMEQMPLDREDIWQQILENYKER